MSASLTLHGKVALVTGANTGIGKVTAHELAKMGAHVVLACRSREKTRSVMDEIAGAVGGARLDFLPLDLSDFDSIKAAANEFLRGGSPLHLLVNNAGMAGARGRTRSGYELHFGVNHMGHFLLTRLLLSRLQESAPARVVTVASDAHLRAHGIDFEAVRRPTASRTGVAEYRQSKLANVFFSAELARRVDRSRITTYSLHPGVVASDIWRHVPWPARAVMKLFMLSPLQGAQTTLYCSTSPDAARETGLYYDASCVKRPSSVAADDALARRLWEWSEKETAKIRD